MGLGPLPRVSQAALEVSLSRVPGPFPGSRDCWLNLGPMVVGLRSRLFAGSQPGCMWHPEAPEVPTCVPLMGTLTTRSQVQSQQEIHFLSSFLSGKTWVPFARGSGLYTRGHLGDCHRILPPILSKFIKLKSWDSS